ncbi:hypothetical protein [Actinoplanes sp. NPDC051851]|uniref:hypothetical protein n=1 Tax=Actinoplanes sp. NPDC051851 TaxID=3154753 RepID=UPI003449E31E
MTAEPRQVEQRAAAAGFVAGEFVRPEDVPTPMAVWKPIIRIGAEPSVRIPDSADDRIGTTWLRLARGNGTIGADGALLLSVGGAGELPWLWVTIGAEDPDVGRLSLDGFEPEFVAIAVDGRAHCAVTSEEYETWIFASPAVDAG